MFERELKDRTGEIIIAVAVILIVFTSSIYIYWTKNASLPKEEAEMRAINNMVVKFNANDNWRTKLEGLDEIYISDVQEELVRKDARPVLLYVQVVDVSNSNDKSIIQFRSREASEPEIRFNLECDPQQAKMVIGNRNTDFEYAVIASISSVDRWSHKSDEDSEPFMANGRCLDLMPISYQ